MTTQQAINFLKSSIRRHGSPLTPQEATAFAFHLRQATLALRKRGVCIRELYKELTS